MNLNASSFVSRLSLPALAVAATLIAAPASAAIVQNGSFESGPVPGQFATLGGGDTSITGWTVIGNSIDYIGSYWTASDGSRSLDIVGNGGTGGVQQTLNGLTVGQIYRVTFDLAGNPAGGASTVKNLVASAGGTTANFSFDTAGHNLANMGWVSSSFLFTAASTSALLSFSGNDPACCYGPALDNVAVTAVPEPSTWAMMMFGFAGLGYLGWRNRRRALPIRIR